MTCLCRLFQMKHQRAEEPSNEPCAARCGKCSTCIRAVSAWYNTRKYGQPDYPGVSTTVDTLFTGAREKGVQSVHNLRDDDRHEGEENSSPESWASDPRPDLDITEGIA